MQTWINLLAALAVVVTLGSGTAFGQAKPADCPKPGAPEKVEGEVVKVDPDQGKLTVRASDGTTHEFQASKETLQEIKVGDRIGAKLRRASDCPP